MLQGPKVGSIEDAQSSPAASRHRCLDAQGLKKTPLSKRGFCPNAGKVREGQRFRIIQEVTKSADPLTSSSTDIHARASHVFDATLLIGVLGFIGGSPVQLAKRRRARGNCLSRRDFAVPTRIHSLSHPLHGAENIPSRRFAACVRRASFDSHHVCLLVMGARSCAQHPRPSTSITHGIRRGKLRREELALSTNMAASEYKSIVQVACVRARLYSFPSQSDPKIGIMSAPMIVGVYIFEHLVCLFAQDSVSRTVLHDLLECCFFGSKHALSYHSDVLVKVTEKWRNATSQKSQDNALRSCLQQGHARRRNMHRGPLC